jgi:hypothetical protein
MTEPAPHPEFQPDPGSVSAPIPLPVAHRGATAVPVQAASVPPPAISDAEFGLSLEMRDLGVRARSIPILGGLAAVFGVAALFKAPLVLAPLGLLFALAALFRRQVGLAVIGAVSAVVALAITPTVWILFGLAWLYDYLT